jgi:hypothetical protein
MVQRQFAHRSLNQIHAATANESDAAVSVPARDNQLTDEDTPQPRNFASALSKFERKSVKGAPFSAELVIETVQPVRNGPGTLHRAAYIVYRDGEGRTRRDQMGEQTGSATISDQPQRSVLNDLVSGFTYVLEHREHSARRSVSLPAGDPNSGETAVSGGASSARVSAPYQILAPDASRLRKGSQVAIAMPVSSHTEKEPLGQREIEGVTAEGTRLIKTIPAGAFGNRQPIRIVVEQWYSPDLQVMVLIKHTDPRFGESVYRLTNISRSEPTATLFAVPGDYKIKDEAAKETSPRN